MNIRDRRAQRLSPSGLALASTEGGRVVLGAGAGAVVALGLAAAFFNAGAVMEAPAVAATMATPIAPRALGAPALWFDDAPSPQAAAAAAPRGASAGWAASSHQPALAAAATARTDVGDGLDHLAARAQAFWRAASASAPLDGPAAAEPAAAAAAQTTPAAAAVATSASQPADQPDAANAEFEASLAAIIAARAPIANPDGLSPPRREALERRRRDAIAEALELYAAAAARLGRHAAAVEASTEASSMRVAALHQSPNDPALAAAAYRSLVRLGDALVAASRPQDATQSFRDAHALAERLAMAELGEDAAPVEARQRDLAIASAKLGAVIEPTEPAAAQRRYREALAVFGDLDARDALPPSDYASVALLIQRVRTAPPF